MKMIAMSTFAGSPLIAGLTMTLAVGSAFAAAPAQEPYGEHGAYRMTRYATDPPPRYVADPPTRVASNQVCTIESTHLGRPYCFVGNGLPYGWTGMERPGY